MVTEGHWSLIIWHKSGLDRGRRGYYKLTPDQTYAMGVGYKIYGFVFPFIGLGIRLEKPYYSGVSPTPPPAPEAEK